MLRPTVRQRRAFSLLELCVVVAVIAVVIGLMVPAVQKVRAAASRAHCANNLRQIGLAFHGYHDLCKVLPTGGRNSPRCGNASLREDFSWCHQILPFIEQSSLYKATDLGKLDTSLVPVYYCCPARRDIRLYHGQSVCDYGGNGGTDLDDGLNGTVIRTGAGAISLHGGIPDGTSSTLLLGERRVNLAYLDTVLDPQDNQSCFRYGWGGDGIRWARPIAGTWQTPAPDLNDPTAHPAAPDYQFGSSHSAGTNVCFADGSVRTISFGVDATLFMRVCVRNDNQPVNGNALD